MSEMKKENNGRPYKELTIDSSSLEIPRSIYQRGLDTGRVMRIVKNFDEKLANDPKVSYRDGHYYVFDGQHTIEARKILNGGKNLPVKCHVFYGLTEKDEARLFSKQFGESRSLSSGEKLRAQVAGKVPSALEFVNATKEAGILIDYDNKRGKYRLSCVGTARHEFYKVGTKHYKEALQLILEIWEGDPDSLRSEILQCMSRFCELYEGRYDRKKLVSSLKEVSPLTIIRDGKSLSANVPGYKRYILQVLDAYNKEDPEHKLSIRI